MPGKSIEAKGLTKTVASRPAFSAQFAPSPGQSHMPPIAPKLVAGLASIVPGHAQKAFLKVR